MDEMCVPSNSHSKLSHSFSTPKLPLQVGGTVRDTTEKKQQLLHSLGVEVIEFDSENAMDVSQLDAMRATLLK